MRLIARLSESQETSTKVRSSDEAAHVPQRWKRMAKSSRAKRKGPMRVLWIVDSMRNALEEAQLGAFLKAVDRSELRVDLLALQSEARTRLGKEVEALGCSVSIAAAQNPSDVRGLLRARRRIRDGNYQLLHTHMSWAADWGVRAGRKLRIPVVATLYGPRAAGSDTEEGAKEEERAIQALRKRAARVIALSGAQWDRYIQEGLFPRALLEVIYQGVEIDETPVHPDRAEARGHWFRETTGFPVGAQVCLTVADLDDWESGVDVLLWAVPEILAANSQARFVIVGEGDHREELERRVRARGLNKLVSWLAPNVELSAVMAESHLFIHPSLRDPFPIVALKAMAAGLPVVGTRVGGVPEIIGTSEAGRLVPRSDADTLAGVVIELLEEPHVLAAMGRSAHARAKKLFPVEGWVDRLARSYRTVIEEASDKGRPRSMTYARLNVELLSRPTTARPRQPKKMRYAGSSSSTS